MGRTSEVRRTSTPCPGRALAKSTSSPRVAWSLFSAVAVAAVKVSVPAGISAAVAYPKATRFAFSSVTFAPVIPADKLRYAGVAP